MHRLTTGSRSHVNVQTLEKIISSKVRCEVYIVVAMVENRVQRESLFLMDNLIISMVKVAIRSANPSSARNPSSFVLDRDQKNFLGNTDDLHMTVSNKFN